MAAAETAWISVKEAARRLRVRERDILGMCRKGLIKIRRSQGELIVHRGDVAFIREAALFNISPGKVFSERRWAMRKCILCDKEFRSRGPEHRVCKRCRPVFEARRLMYPEDVMETEQPDTAEDQE